MLKSGKRKAEMGKRKAENGKRKWERLTGSGRYVFVAGTFDFPARVKDGFLRGEHGTNGSLPGLGSRAASRSRRIEEALDCSLGDGIGHGADDDFHHFHAGAISFR